MSNFTTSNHSIKAEHRAKGGARRGAGRHPDWFKQKCAAIVDRKELVEFVGRVASGEESDHKLSKDGDVIEVPASIHDRLYASEMLFDRGFGKPVPMIDGRPTTPEDSKRKAEEVWALIKNLEECANANSNARSDSRSLASGSSSIQTGA